MKSADKRKRDEKETISPYAKRRKVIMEGTENVKYVSLAKRLEQYYKPPPSLGNVKPFALLPDWKDRFANDTGVAVKKAMPEAMKKAAQAQDFDTPPKQRQFDALVEDGDEEEWMDEDEDEDLDGNEGAEDMGAQLASLDPEALKAVLKQRLGDAGLGNMDEGAFMSTIAKILSGDEGADDATGDLANAILGQATQGNDSALSGWLSQQGVSLEEAEDDDDASSIAAAELPGNSGKDTKSHVEVSPPDSGIEMLKQTGEKREMAMHGSSPSASAKKRAAPVDEDDEIVVKRKKVTFDMPSSSQSTQAAAVQNDDIETSNTEVPYSIEPEVEATASEDPLLSVPAIHSAGHSISVNEKAIGSNGSASTRATGAKNYAKPTAAASAKQNRKRKAEPDEDEIEVAAPKPKRPARKAAKSAAEVPEVEPPARRTRSARAKAGK